ncbi:DMT family transporter [Pectobacterium brasiliense]|uniref:DMT family transporter n=1 Tax=Pectobacterium brasiliense TaxID=180957 RepID=A0AAW9HEG8_9GAMM|nr:DMT family transporter [Pectobacterium brasiliense]MDY4379458.1 DMT family transporter [Pectobacterium brasiliense]
MNEPSITSKNTTPQITGVMIYIIAIFFMAVMDATAKWLTGSYPVSEIVFFRSIFAFIPLMVIIYKSKADFSLASSAIYYQIIRGILVAGTVATFFLSAKHLPLANVTAISLANPFFMVLFCWVLKWEKVSVIRMIIIAMGFSGVLIEINGVDLSFSIYSLIAILSTIFYALAAVMTKYLSKIDSSIVTAFYTNAVIFIVASILFSSAWKIPNLHDFAIFFMMGVAGGISNYFFTVAFRFADVSTVAPLEYTVLIWAALFGFFIFGETPTIMMILGAAIIIISGVLNLRYRT